MAVPTAPAVFEPPATGPNGTSVLPNSNFTFSNRTPSWSAEISVKPVYPPVPQSCRRLAFVERLYGALCRTEVESAGRAVAARLGRIASRARREVANEAYRLQFSSASGRERYRLPRRRSVRGGGKLVARCFVKLPP